MSDFLLSLLHTANDAGRALLLWSWQACLLLTFVFLLLKLSRFRAAAVRYQVWLVTLVAIASLPVCTTLVQNYFTLKPQSMPMSYIVDLPANLIVLPAEVQTERIKSSPTTASFSFRQADYWSLIILAWLAGFVFMLKQLLAAYWQTRKARLCADAISLDELGCVALADGFLASKVTQIRLSGFVSSPLLIGLWHPMILLPADILQWTSAEERQTILLHEMTHAQRQDHWANLFQSLLQAVFFFHPFVRYAANQLSIERELSCDEQVLSLGAKASSYVESILKVAEKSVAVADVLHQPAFITKKMLERRIEMILKNDRLKGSAGRWTLLILPVALIAVMLWVLVPNRSASAGGSQEQTSEMQERERRQKIERENEMRQKETLLAKGKLLEKIAGELNPHREMELKQALQGAEVLAQVADLKVIYGKRHDSDENLIDVDAAETIKMGEVVKFSNVVVKTPEFAFKAEHAEGQNGILNLIGIPIEVESRGRTFYSYNAIAIANRGSMVMYVVSKHARLHTQRNQLSDSVEFSKLLKDEN